MTTIEDLTEAAEELKRLTERREKQQRLVDHLIAKAKAEGHGWAELQKATGYYNRSLQLAIRRTEGAEPS